MSRGALGLQLWAAPVRPGQGRQPGSPERGSAEGPRTQGSGPPGGGGTGEHLPAPPEEFREQARGAPQSPGGAGAAPARRSEPSRGRSGRTPRQDPLLESIPPGRPQPCTPRGAPASRAHLRGLEPGPPRPRSAPRPLPLRLRGGLAPRAPPGGVRRGGASHGNRPHGAGPQICKSLAWGGASHAN